MGQERTRSGQEGTRGGSNVQLPKAHCDLSTDGMSKSHGNQAAVHLPETNDFQLLRPNHSVPAAS